MNGYEPGIPRLTSGVSAVVMAAVSLAVFVILPAGMDTRNDAGTSTASHVVTVGSAGVGAGGASVNLHAVHEPESSQALCTSVNADHAQDS